MSAKFTSLSNPKLVELLASGKIGVIPTDTVYGLVCQASDETAIGRLYSVKSRQQKPGTIIAANIGQLVDLGLKKRYLTAVETFWPGRVSVVIPSYGQLNYLHLGKNSLAVRVIAKKELCTLLETTGPLLSTSANHPGEPEAINISEAEKYFGDNIDFYVDGGDLSEHLPSTIIRVVDDAIEIIREGAVEVTESGIIKNKGGD